VRNFIAEWKCRMRDPYTIPEWLIIAVSAIAVGSIVLGIAL
jgi:hypothetical protein